MPDPIQLCTFRVDTLHFGVEVLRVQEVLRAQAMTAVPLAHDAVSGLINLRGQIVTAVDMRRRLGLPAAPEGAALMNVIVRAEDGAVSLIVDDIGDVIEVEDETHEEVPPTVPPALRALLRGVHKLDRQLLLVLDPDRAVDLATAAA